MRNPPRRCLFHLQEAAESPANLHRAFVVGMYFKASLVYMPEVTHIQNGGTATKDGEQVCCFQTLSKSLCLVPKVEHLILYLESQLLELLD